MHTSDCQIVVIIVSQSHSTDEHRNDSAHPKKLSQHVTQYSKDISKGDLSNLIFCEKSAFFEDIRAQQSSKDSNDDGYEDCPQKASNNRFDDFACSHVRVNLVEKTTYINLNLPTTLKRMIATASLTSPSPKMIEKSLGNSLALRRVREATLSEAEIVALYFTMRLV